ncbi:MAG: nucleotidyltransferase [Lewinellaceae bacterium]|nr:nucleotidyltransferase [Lewinellaceae bacterium]
MIYNEEKLASFARRAFKYEEQKIKDTHEAIRKAISTHYDGDAVKEKYGLPSAPVLDIYLQGSYKNHTNVTKSSDVDLVVQVTSIWMANKQSLPPEQLEKYNSSHRSIDYPFAEFNIQIFHALQEFFGEKNLKNGNKCLKLTEHGKYCNADIIPCFTYREYGYFKSESDQKCEKGMYFITNNGQFVRNFPKQHYDALTEKSKNTDGRFKETVRMFKNMKDDLIEKGIINEGTAKSYFIENMLYNIPVTYFSGTFTERFENIMEHIERQWLTEAFHKFKCANGIDDLISDQNWKIENAQQFLIALIQVRDETEL